MTYKTILADANAGHRTNQITRVAIELARSFESHLVGAAGMCQPAYYVSDMIGVVAAQDALYLDYLRESARTALEIFEASAQKAGLPSFEQRLIEDEQEVALCMQAPYADLLVLGQPDPDEIIQARRFDFTEFVLMHAGRPILMLPYAGNFDKIGREVMIAWDGRAAAARAVTAALPFLRRAANVRLVVFVTPGSVRRHRGQPGADAALFLASHGVKVEVVERIADSDTGIGDLLLSLAAECGADLLVMGAYGHARMREILLGGVTKTILQTMTLPVLFAH